MSSGQMLLGQTSPWQLTFIEEGPRNLRLKFGQNRVSNSWDIPDMDKCRLDKCRLDKCHRDSYDGPRNLRLKFGQNQFSNSWDITDIEFWWWVVDGGCGGGVQSHFNV